MGMRQTARSLWYNKRDFRGFAGVKVCCMAWLMTLGGFALLWVGGEFLVGGGVGLARRHGISGFTIGLTIVAFGTSAPELMVSCMAALDGNGDVALANVVGSNIANIALILGVTLVLQRVRINRDRHPGEVSVLLLVTMLLVWLLTDGKVARWDGGIILLAFACFLWRCFHLRAVGLEEEDDMDDCVDMSSRRACVEAAGGLVLLGIGGRLSVTGAVEVATSLGLSNWFIGVTVVALGTSLPELAASVVAARRGQAGMALGNVLGSNIFNTLLIPGAAAGLRPLVPTEAVGVDLAFMVSLTLLIWYWARSKELLLRRHGALLLFFYVSYILIKLI